MKKREEEIVKAIYHKNVAGFFESMGLSKKLSEGILHCNICGEVLTLNNFRAIARKSGKLIFCCDKESCILKFSSYLEEC